MKNLNWGAIPTQRTRKKEKFHTPVLSMTAIEGEKKGAGRKFTFNKAAKQLLGFSGEADAIALAFEGGEVYVKVAHPTAEGSIQLTKTGSFSNKRIYNVITKTLNLNNEVENYFSVTAIDGGIYQLSLVDTGLVTPSTPVMSEMASSTGVDSSSNLEETSVEEVVESNDSATENENEW